MSPRQGVRPQAPPGLLSTRFATCAEGPSHLRLAIVAHLGAQIIPWLPRDLAIEIEHRKVSPSLLLLGCNVRRLQVRAHTLAASACMQYTDPMRCSSQRGC